jgi:rod shape-determining protein MreD
MSAYLAFAILFLLALLQSTVMPHITLMGVHPDLMLMAVTAWSLLRGSEEGMLWALVGGIVLDLLSGAPFGIWTLALLVVGFAAGLGQRNVFRFDLLIPILVTPFATLVHQLIALGMLSLLGWHAGWNKGLTRVIFPSILVNTLTMPIVYLIARWVHRRTGQERISW